MTCGVTCGCLQDDMAHFHGTYKKVCDKHDAEYYAKFKKVCASGRFKRAALVMYSLTCASW